MTYLSFHSRDLFPREFAAIRPGEKRQIRFIINNPWELRRAVDRYAGRNLYLGVLPLKPGVRRWELIGNFSRWVRLTTLYFDVDHEGRLDLALQETRRIVKALLAAGYFPRVYFSGKKGFAIYLDFAEYSAPPEHVKRILRGAYDRLRENLGLTGLDPTVAEPSRVSRIPNTLHPGSGLYCLPLRMEELALSPEKMVDLAKSPRPDFLFDEGRALLQNTPLVHRRLWELEEEARVAEKWAEARRVAAIFHPPPPPKNGWLAHPQIAPLLRGLPKGRRWAGATVLAAAVKKDARGKDGWRERALDVLRDYWSRCENDGEPFDPAMVKDSLQYAATYDNIPWAWLRDLEAAGVLRRRL